MKKNYYNFLRSKPFTFIVFSIVFICSGSTLYVVNSSVPYLPLLLLIFFYPVLVHAIVNINKNNIKIILIYLSWIIISVFCMVLNTDFSKVNFYLNFVATVSIALGIYFTYSFEDFSKYTTNSVFALNICTVVGKILQEKTGIIDSFPIKVSINGWKYRFGLLYSYNMAIPKRCSGFFWEPGLLASFAAFAIILDLLYRKDKFRIYRIILCFVVILVSTSSAGYVLFGLCVVIIICSLDKKESILAIDNFISKLVSFCVFAFSIIVVLNIDAIIRSLVKIFNSEYLMKLSSDKVMNTARVLAIWHNIDLFCSSPLVGVGKSVADNKMMYVADSSTSTYLLSIFGIFGVLYTVRIVSAALKIKGNLYLRIAILILLLVIVNKEPHTRFIFTWCLILYMNSVSNDYYVLEENALTVEKNEYVQDS